MMKNYFFPIALFLAIGMFSTIYLSSFCLPDAGASFSKENWVAYQDIAKTSKDDGNGSETPTKCNFDWVGDTSLGTESVHDKEMITLVIAYCKQNLEWVEDYTRGFTIKKLYIISKCDVPVEGLNLQFNAKVIVQPNVGRCDHSWAYWMAYEFDSTAEGTVVFLKDTHGANTHQVHMEVKSLAEMVRGAKQCGLGCGYRETGGYSMWHISKMLGTFQLGAYKHQPEYTQAEVRPFGNWLKSTFEYEMPSLMTPVCYGGSFAVEGSRIGDKVDVMSKIEKILGKSSNNEEGHYMERSWAMFFYDALDEAKGVELLSSADKYAKEFYYPGMLTKRPALATAAEELDRLGGTKNKKQKT